MVPRPREMRYRGWLTVLPVVFVLLILAMAVLSSGCGKKSEPSAKDLSNKATKDTRPILSDRELSQVVVYYQTQDEHYLAPITVSFNPTREAAKTAVEKLLAGPVDSSLKPVMPGDVKLRRLYFLNSQDIIYVDLTKELLNINQKEVAEKAIKALVLTLTEYNQSQLVQIFVEGETVSEIAGVKTDEPFSRPAFINNLSSDIQKGVQVYFNDFSARYLIPVTVNMPAGATINDMPRATVLSLIAGPREGSGLTRTIWPGTRLIDMKVENGIATVNFSKEIIGYGGGTTAETSLVNSLLFTLTQFEEIERVQLLIEGEKRDYLPEGTAIGKPLSRPEQLNFLTN